MLVNGIWSSRLFLLYFIVCYDNKWNLLEDNKVFVKNFGLSGMEFLLEVEFWEVVF